MVLDLAYIEYDGRKSYSTEACHLRIGCDIYYIGSHNISIRSDSFRDDQFRMKLACAHGAHSV